MSIAAFLPMSCRLLVLQALSRGKMIAEMVNKKRGQKSSQNDLVTKATDWGTKVWNISS